MTDPRPSPPPPIGDSASDNGDDHGGDSVCWLARVCPECGLLADHDPPTRCSRCGKEFSDD